MGWGEDGFRSWDCFPDLQRPARCHPVTVTAVGATLSLIRQLRICCFFRTQPEVLKGMASLACGLSPAFLLLLGPGFLFPSVIWFCSYVRPPRSACGVHVPGSAPCQDGSGFSVPCPRGPLAHGRTVQGVPGSRPRVWPGEVLASRDCVVLSACALTVHTQVSFLYILTRFKAIIFILNFSLFMSHTIHPSEYV